jgi:hypothetical protein
MSNTLPISRLINVNVTLTPQAAQAQNINTLLILGSSSVIDVVSRLRSYASLAAVAADFGTSAPEYLAAALWFEQNPQPTQLSIGRWAKTASSGQLFGGALSAAQQLPGAWTSITDGGFTITIDGGSAQDVVGLNFSLIGNMNAVAAKINTVLTGATVAWSSTYNRFVVTSGSTGVNSSVSFATPGTGGGVTDISSMLGLTVGSSGSYQATGIAAESALTAVTILDNQAGMQWFGLTIIGAADSDHLAIAPYIEADTTKHFYGVTTQEATVLTPGDTSDIAYLLQQQGYNFTMVQYSSTNPYAVVSALARILTTNYGGQNTVITLMYKQEPGITPESLTLTQVQALEAKNCDVFVSYNNNTAILEAGTSASGNYVDTVIGAAVWAIEIQTAVYNLLYTSPTKVPQTDQGTQMIITTIAQVCAQFVQNGFLGPGQWNGNGFGALQTGQVMAKGYYIWGPSVTTQTQAQRASRISVPIQIAGKLAGAVQDVNVSILVNS